MAAHRLELVDGTCERADADLLFRWSLDTQPGDDAFDPTTSTHNRDRLQTRGLARAFFDAAVCEAIAAGLCSERFTVDGTLIESWAAPKGFQPVEAGEAVPPDANGVGENRHGLILAVAVTEASGAAERAAALGMLDRRGAELGLRAATVGADKGYDDGQCLLGLEGRRTEPHVPLVKAPRDPAGVRHRGRRPGVEARHRMRARQDGEGYRLSQRCRKKVEEGFGWLKTIAGPGRSRVIGRWKLGQLREAGAAAYNLVRLRSLKPA